MKKVIFSAIVVLFLIIISGCGQMGGDSSTSMSEDIYKGTKAVGMKFLPQSPPSEVFEGNPLNILVEYSNEGAHTITTGNLYLTGYDPGFVFDSQSVMSWSIGGLEGKTLLNPVGTQMIAEFNDNDIRKPDNVDRFTQKLKLTACYDYITLASAQVCIDPRPYDLSGDKKICSAGIVSLSGGQGGPVAVTKIDERIAGDRVQFKIYFKNMGTGDVFRFGSSSHCYSQLGFDDMDKVVVHKVTFSNEKNLQCEPDLGSNIRLNNGEGFVICYYDGLPSTGDEYLTNLNIELRYGYRESITKTIDILDIPGGPSGSSSSSSSSTSSSSGNTCGDMCAAAVGHADSPWCYCSRTGSCPSDYRPIGNSGDGCAPCCAKL